MDAEKSMEGWDFLIVIGCWQADWYIDMRLYRRVFQSFDRGFAGSCFKSSALGLFVLGCFGRLALARAMTSCSVWFG
jgi:hypothetical protein